MPNIAPYPLQVIYRFLFVLSLWFLPSLAAGQNNTLQIAIDATDLPRKLLRATISIPLSDADHNNGTVALWYPKWVPGSHGPGGPIENVAGMLVRGPNGNRLTWRRTVGEVHRVIVDVPAEVDTLTVELRYISNQPSTNSMGHDSFGSALIGVVSPSTIFLYPEGMDNDAMHVAASLRLPETWTAATALPASSAEEGAEGANLIQYESVPVRTFIDSPIMCGRHHRTFQLAEEEGIPPHRLHIFSEAASALEVHPEMLELLRAMVTQTARLFESHPFDEFNILLATTDVLPKNGLEHSRSTFNILGQRAYMNPKKLKGWDRLLVPHEYLHAWCGKYRRPQGMTTSDYHTPKETELLWVYEGLTQYLGELIEARAGWMSEEEFKQRLEIEIRAALHQQGRQWRSLADTGACSHTLRARSLFWSRLRRSQDYYMEGMLFWLEADAIIRTETNGEKSLDDFCKGFFAYPDNAPHPLGFTRADVVIELESVLDYDWDGLIVQRVEALVDRFNPAVVDTLGYAVAYSDKKPNIPEDTFRRVKGLDALDSIGAVFDLNGTIKDVLLESPSHSAKLGPGMKVVGVNGSTFSENRLRDALKLSTSKGHLDMMVVNGDTLETRQVKYDGGPKYMTLEEKEGAKNWLKEIVKAAEPAS